MLLITICSNQKIQGGDVFKEAVPSLRKVLPDRADELAKKRAAVLNLIQSETLGRDGINLSQMQFNSRLVQGPEFGGARSGRYLPAAERYAGSFYSAAKKGSDDILSKTKHHVLIVSALYGLILPDELIQVYSCHIEDHPDIASIWTKGEFLTSILISYIRKFAIKKVFDLTAQDVYRTLLDWSRVSSKADVLHAFGEQYAGPALLSSLGELARDHILSKTEEDIAALQPGIPVFLEREKIVFTHDPFPPKGYPRAQKKNVEGNKSENNVPSSDENAFSEAVHDIVILDHPRDINISSKGHNTIFERPINNVNDIPADIKGAFLEISLCPDVLEIFFEKREKGGPSYPSFRFKLFAPQEGTGYIHAKIEGGGSVCHGQDISIRVTKNRETRVYSVLDKLLKG